MDKEILVKFADYILNQKTESEQSELLEMVRDNRDEAFNHCIHNLSAWHHGFCFESDEVEESYIEDTHEVTNGLLDIFAAKLSE